MGEVSVLTMSRAFAIAGDRWCGVFKIFRTLRVVGFKACDCWGFWHYPRVSQVIFQQASEV